MLHVNTTELLLASPWLQMSLLPFFSSLVAEPCELLIAPTNGFVNCDGAQVTNQSCTISCQPGYSAVGSTTRTCLPSHAWDGEQTSCAIMECDELKGSEIILVIQPCSREFGSVCSILCKDGYQVNKTIFGWTQNCALSADGSSVQWTQPLTCIGKERMCNEVTVEL